MVSSTWSGAFFLIEVAPLYVVNLYSSLFIKAQRLISDMFLKKSFLGSSVPSKSTVRSYVEDKKSFVIIIYSFTFEKQIFTEREGDTKREVCHPLVPFPNGLSSWDLVSLRLGTKSLWPGASSGSPRWKQGLKDDGRSLLLSQVKIRELNQNWISQNTKWCPYEMLASQVED